MYGKYYRPISIFFQINLRWWQCQTALELFLDSFRSGICQVKDSSADRPICSETPEVKMLSISEKNRKSDNIFPLKTIKSLSDIVETAFISIICCQIFEKSPILATICSKSLPKFAFPEKNDNKPVNEDRSSDFFCLDLMNLWLCG